MRAKYLLVHIPYSVTYGELQSRALRAWFVTNKLVSSWPGPPIMNSKRIKIELYCFSYGSGVFAGCNIWQPFIFSKPSVKERVMVKKANYSLQANGGKLFSSEAKCQPPTVTQLQRFS